MPVVRSLIVSALCLLTLQVPWAGDATALIADGEARLKAGEVDAAIEVLRQAVATDGASSLAHTRLGGALLLKQAYGPAIDEFRTAIGLSGDNADAFIGMAVAYLHSGDYPLARASLEEAKRVDPAKQAKVDELITYIDQRETAVGGAH
jgi:tetratricopeptide (TPR) repeat protein